MGAQEPPAPPPGFAGALPSDREALLAAPVAWPRPGRLAASVEILPGVGPKTRAALAEDLGIETVGALLSHFPRVYLECERRSLAELADGEPALIEGEVSSVGASAAGARGARRRGSTTATITESGGEGSVRAIWFNQPWVAAKLEAGRRVRLLGVPGGTGFSVSAYAVLPAPGEPVTSPSIDVDPPVPVHPASERLPPQKLRRLVRAALDRAGDRAEPLPAAIRARHRLAGAADAVRAIHFPSAAAWDRAAGDGSSADPPAAALAEARRRLVFEELLLHQVSLHLRRRDRLRAQAVAVRDQGAAVEQWQAGLPFRLTRDQQAAIGEVLADLGGRAPMQRLLMGDVGTGKTVVAAAAMLAVALGGRQAALLAPTAVLAAQHARTLSALLEPAGVSVRLITGATGSRERRELLDGLASGELRVAVGTHALLEEPIAFAGLALAVVDEQHRFGVRQRSALTGKGPSGAVPHLLQMTATPIPRTLAVFEHGDVDRTELRERPSGRPPVDTVVVGPAERAAQIELLRRDLSAGRQAYVICPRVEEIPEDESKSVTAEAERLRREELRGFRVGALHGQMPEEHKQRVMGEFADGNLAVLVATTVVEVGVDVPNATTMMVEGAERFGLAQLHQLRGRVGRGTAESRCLLLPGSGQGSDSGNGNGNGKGSGSGKAAGRGMKRLLALESESDGFRLAELDFHQRGPGERLGARQHGAGDLRLAELPGDAGLLELADREARELVEGPAGCAAAADLLSAATEQRFGGAVPARSAA